MAVLEHWGCGPHCICGKGAPLPNLETKEAPGARWLHPASVEQHIDPLAARVTALEAENARLTDLTNTLRDLALMDAESKQALSRISAGLARLQSAQR